MTLRREQPFSGCLNEDIDRDGRSDVYANGTAEDANGSYNLVPGRPALEPRKADVSISIEGSSTTDTSGKVTLRMEYAKSVGSWVAYNIIVSASGVGGTEGRANFDGVLAVLATDVDDPDVAPAFQFSPYGVLPGDPLPFAVPGAGTVLLCTNPN